MLISRQQRRLLLLQLQGKVLLKLGENERRFANEDRTSSVENFMVFQLNHDPSTVVGGMHKGGSGE